jgi:hypothetical protein
VGGPRAVTGDGPLVAGYSRSLAEPTGAADPKRKLVQAEHAPGRRPLNAWGLGRMRSLVEPLDERTGFKCTESQENEEREEEK